ncbi:MAG: hypothetical protein HYT73_02435 [Candidatus Aenigmarchaeota archaeon]|nr:hypothetical protein [Candidatus Aenigmarchaeota archaeon]
MKKSVEELEVERKKLVQYINEYMRGSVYMGPELYVELYRNVTSELEKARRRGISQS